LGSSESGCFSRNLEFHFQFLFRKLHWQLGWGLFHSWNFTFIFYSENRKGGFNLSPVNLPRGHLLISVLQFCLFWNFTFTFYLKSCTGNRKGGFNLGPVNFPRRHLLVSILCNLEFKFHFLLAKGGFNLGPVNFPRGHLLVSVLGLLLLPLHQAGLRHQLVVHHLRLLQLLLRLLKFCLQQFDL